MFELPGRRRYRLANPPLVLAVAQVNYPMEGRLASLEGITPIQDGIRQSFPYMQPIQINQVQVVFGPAAMVPPAQVSQATVWRFTDDQGWTLDLGPASTHLSVGRTYETVEQMADRLLVLLRALRQAGLPRCERLGVRFIDAIPVSAGEPWSDWFKPEVLGWIGSPILAPTSTLQASLNQTNLFSPLPVDGFDLQVQGVIRHGVLPAGTQIPTTGGLPPESLETQTFLIDLDMSATGPQAFEEESLLARFRLLHDNIDAFFRWCLTESGERHFGLEEA